MHEERRGKGAGLQAGFGAATGDIIVMLDADGSADPAEIPRFVEALVSGADFAKGSRYLAGGGSADLTVVRRFGNVGLTALVNLLYGTSYTDLCYGYNAFWRHCLPYLQVDCDGFEVETLINIRIAKAGLRVAEVPSFEERRIHGQSNLRPFRDGWRVQRTIMRERFGGKSPDAAPTPTSGPTRDNSATNLPSSWRISEAGHVVGTPEPESGPHPSPATCRSRVTPLHARGRAGRCTRAEDRVRLPVLRAASRWHRAPRRADRDADGGGRRRGRGPHTAAGRRRSRAASASVACSCGASRRALRARPIRSHPGSSRTWRRTAATTSSTATATTHCRRSGRCSSGGCPRSSRRITTGRATRGSPASCTGSTGRSARVSCAGPPPSSACPSRRPSSCGGRSAFPTIASS